MGDQSYKAEIEQAKTDVNSLITLVKALEDQLKLALTQARQLGGAFKPKSPNEAISQIKKQGEQVETLTVKLDKLSKLTEQTAAKKNELNNLELEQTNKIIRARDREFEKAQKQSAKFISDKEKERKARLRETDQMQRNKEALAKQKASYEKVAAAQEKVIGAYQKLINKQKQAKTTLQNLIASEKASNRAIRKAQKEYDKYTAKVNKANRATSNFSKTGLGGMVSGFRNLLGAFGLVGGAMMFTSMLRGVFELIKTLNSLDFSMKAVIKDQAELGQTQLWLSDITNNFGAGLVTTTNRYIKFRAATQQAGLSARETQNIFGTMAKAAGVLGLKTDELTGIFLALEQMVSKGKITTEELRRQLGERLPGAMDIMATSIGVTTSELDDMMKKGQIITKDVLPGFARQVEIAFGIENVKKVETLVAAQIRLSNTWIRLVHEFEKGNEVSKELMKVFDFLAKNLRTIVALIWNVVKAFLAYKAVIIAATLITKAWTAATVIAEITVIAFTKGLKAAKTAVIELNIASSANPWVLLAKVVLAVGVAIWAFKDGVDFAAASQELLNKAMKEGEEIAEEYSKTINQKLVTSFSKLAKKQMELLELTGDLNEQEEIRKGINQEKIELLEIEKEGLSKLIIAYTAQLGLYQSGSPIYEKYKKIVLDLADKYSLLTEEIRDLNEVTKDEQNFAEGTIGWLRERISANNKLIEQSKDKSLIKQLQDRNKEHQKEIDLLLGKSKAIKKVENDFAEESVGWLKEKISANKKLILQSKDRSQIKQWQDQNDEWQKAIDLLLGVSKALKKVSKVVKNSEKDWEANIKALKEQRSNLKLNSFEWGLLDAVIKGMEIGFKKLKGEMDLKEEGENLRELFEGLTETFTDVFGIDFSKFDFLFDELENSVTDWANLSKELIGSVLDATLQRYELELIEAQRTRDLILENDLASEEEKENARKKFDARERKIKNERAKAERDNILIKIALDTASAIVQALPNLALSIAVGAIGLAQASIAASLPLPKFKEGTKSAPKGWSLTQEKRAEPITDKFGRLKTMGSKGGAMFTPLEKGDRVFRSQDEFFNEYGGDAIHKAVWSMNMAGNGRELSKKIVDNSLLKETKGLRKDIDVMGRRIGKLASRPINNNVTVEIKDDRPY